MEYEDINKFIPSLLNPRTVPKDNCKNLTQTSITSRCSLSLRKSVKKARNKEKENLISNKNVTPSTKLVQEVNVDINQNVSTTTKEHSKEKNICSSIEDLDTIDKQNCYKSYKDFVNKDDFICNKNVTANVRLMEKDNVDVNQNVPVPTIDKVSNKNEKDKRLSKDNTVCSSIRDLDLESIDGLSSFADTVTADKQNGYETFKDCDNIPFDLSPRPLTISSATDLIDKDISEKDSVSTTSYSLTEKPTVSVSIGLINSPFFKISTTKNNIKNVSVAVNNNITNVDLDIIESSQASLYKSDSGQQEVENSTKDITMSPSPPKNIPVAVHLEIKKKSLEDSNANSLDAIENSKVLILNTSNARLSHVIVQPPNNNLLKRKFPNARKIINSAKKTRVFGVQNVQCENSLKQSRIDQFFVKKSDVVKLHREPETTSDDVASKGLVMSKNPVRSASYDYRDGIKSLKEPETPPRSNLTPKRASLKQVQLKQNVKATNSEVKRNQSTNQSVDSSKKNVHTLQFSLPSRTLRNSAGASSTSPKIVPSHKIVKGTNFAVDAFSYGEIPNIKYYFLTHFHSDHYCGLKKSFNKTLYCSKITAELCVSRLGVNPRCIRVFNCDEIITVDDVVVTAVDANHCPGALMLIFTLANGKSILHTGDFRASPLMESYPVFWNNNIHTVYLDTTYCNPRYDFPSQEQSLEMALYLLREKKLALEKASRKFSSVLIVCGTYTIGKEKFFLGLARRLGCSVWACPEKDRVLQAVEGRSFSHAPPQSCQLHVVPMRDLTHEKLQEYLASLQGAFSEVVAFKPSGWENGKTTAITKDNVTIHGIPYSEHSSFSEMIRFVKFLRPKLVVPTVDIAGGVKSVQKYFPCPLIIKDTTTSQSRLTSYYIKPSTAIIGSAAS